MLFCLTALSHSAIYLINRQTKGFKMAEIIIKNLQEINKIASAAILAQKENSKTERKKNTFKVLNRHMQDDVNILKKMKVPMIKNEITGEYFKVDVYKKDQFWRVKVNHEIAERKSKKDPIISRNMALHLLQYGEANIIIV